MCRSSRIVGFLIFATIAAAIVPVEAQARGFGFAGGRFAFAGARFGLGSARFKFGTGSRFGVRSGFGRGSRGRLGRFGRGYGYGGLGGFGSYGFEGADLPFGGSPGVDPAAYPVPDAVPVAPPQPICPLIIRVGAGLRHAARAKVVYGRQTDCR